MKSNPSPSEVKRRPYLAIKAAAVQRLLMWHFFSDRIPLFLVSEHPKSGGTWFSQMLADYLEIPFPRNRRPRFETSVLHGHHLYHPRFENAICVFRDGRDIMVSAYFHSFFEHERHKPATVRRNRRNLPFDDYNAVRENLPRFIEYCFTRKSRGFGSFSWDEFVCSWMDSGAPIVRYEDMLKDAAGELGRAIQAVTNVGPDPSRLAEIAKKYSFERLARRKAGQENTRSFLRKGVAGDWRNKFTLEAGKVFDHYAGDILIRAGYEEDRSWIKELHPS